MDQLDDQCPSSQVEGPPYLRIYILIPGEEAKRSGFFSKTAWRGKLKSTVKRRFWYRSPKTRFPATPMASLPLIMSEASGF
jgi:hypothetical protein